MGRNVNRETQSREENTKMEEKKRQQRDNEETTKRFQDVIDDFTFHP